MNWCKDSGAGGFEPASTLDGAALPALMRPAGQRGAGGLEPASENSCQPRGPAVEVATHLTPLTHSPPPDGTPGPKDSSSRAPYYPHPGLCGASGMMWVVQLDRSYPRPAEGGRPNATMHHSSPRASPATTCLPAGSQGK